MRSTELSRIAYTCRDDILDMLFRSKAGHVGGDMSVIETLVTLYHEVMNVSPEKMTDPDRDRLIMSKGHCTDALYMVLSTRGYFDRQDLKDTYCNFGTRYIGHPNTDVPGVETNGGSLGHGLSVGAGMAMAGKMDGRDYRVYVVLGDGEMDEGSNYEAMMAAAHYKLDNLCAVLDLNGLQMNGPTAEMMNTDSLAEKFASFHWNVIEVSDGNDPQQLMDAFAAASAHKGTPSVVVAHTVKGKGISYMENQASWHHGVMNEEQYLQAKKEIAAKLEELGGRWDA